MKSMKKMLLLLVCICASYSAMAAATLTQKEWRWRNDDGNETTATWKAGEQEAISMNWCTATSGEILRLRMNMLVNPDAANPSNAASRTVDRYLQYAPSPSGPWTQIDGSSNVFRTALSTQVTNNTPATQQLSSTDRVSGSGLIVDGSTGDQLMFSTPPGVVTRREYEWVIQALTVEATTYYFRYGGANTYPNTLPSITFYDAPTASTQNITVCDETSYESPSGEYTWTTAGVYNDTIPNANGCDSVITTNLKFGNRSYNAFSVNACQGYDSPSGAYTWMTSGVYNDTIPNAMGCDSVLTVNLTITRVYNAFEESACERYESPSGNYTWTTSGIYNDTIPNTQGCDSVITIDLTIHYNTTHAMIEEACESFESPSGEYTWTTSGIYNDTIPNAIGCDSIITIDLTIHYNTEHSMTQLACESFESPSGEYTWTTSGTYNDTIPNANGCDSVLTINLTIGHPATGTDTRTACGSYTWIDNVTYTASNTTAMHTVHTAAGCDSVVTLNLTIDNVNLATTLSGLTITAAAGADSYQWMNCNTESEIPGATGTSFTATANGSYAVRINDGECSGTSDCVAITTVGLQEMNNDLFVSIVPNPTNGLFSIQCSEGSAIALTVRDVQGKTVLTGAGIVSGQSIDLSAVENGVYFLQISSANGTAVQRIVKN
jgi:hypothetical protein